MAVNGFVIEAIRKIVASSQPTAAVTGGSPATEYPAASAGTPHAVAAASAWLENGAFMGNPLPYWRARPRPSRVFLRGELRPG